MSKSLKVIIFLTIVGVSLLCVTGNKGRGVNINCDKPPVNQTARHGSSVTITCKYPREEESNTKHFCRKNEKSVCKNLISTHTSKYTRRDRFSLKDEELGGVYTVTISTLTEDDAGIYRCFMERVDGSTACLFEIDLSVLNWDDIALKSIHHKTGEAAHIKCTYSNNDESNEKSLCKGENPFICEELIHTTDQDRDVSRGRFHIRDNRRKKNLYVDISNLRVDDSGLYWCGSRMPQQFDKYTRILLTVAERHIREVEDYDLNNDPSDNLDNTPEGQIDNRPVDKGMIVAVVMCLALLLILVVVLVLCRHNLPRTRVCCTAQGSKERTNADLNIEGNQGDHQYEEIQIRNEQASSRDPLPSVYATVNPPPDQLHYASVNFSNDVLTDGNALPDTKENCVSACDYSSISGSEGATHPPLAELAVYSTVSKPGE